MIVLARILFLGVLAVAFLMAGCSSGHRAEAEASRKLRTILIQDEKLEGSPNEIVAQLNVLAKKYDPPTHQGIVIRFDPAVNGECCSMAIFRRGESLASWLRDICDSCRSDYRIDATGAVIELLPLSQKRTPHLELNLTNGMAKLCFQFRSSRGHKRRALAKELFDLLPRSPVTSTQDIGSGTIVGHDYRHPSYKLYKRDVIALLGDPDRNVNNERFYYDLEPEGEMIWELGVEFGTHEYVINPNLFGYVRK